MKNNVLLVADFLLAWCGVVEVEVKAEKFIFLAAGVRLSFKIVVFVYEILRKFTRKCF